MSKNYLIFSVLALALSACTSGSNVKPNVPMQDRIDAENSITNQTGNITRNVGDRTAVINQTGKNLPR